MKCISLWQPWASAIPLGLKKIETRGWSTNVRGRIAIHASKRWTPEVRNFHAARRRAGDPLPETLPLGAIVATALLVRVESTESLLGIGISDLEQMYGIYGQGRFGWILEDVVPMAEPIPFKGAQGFFTVPDALFTDRERQPAPEKQVSLLNPACAWPFPVSAHTERGA